MTTMRSRWRRMLSLTLSVLMAASMWAYQVPVSWAADTGNVKLETPAGVDTGLTYSITDAGVLTITGTGAIPNYEGPDTSTTTGSAIYTNAPWQKGTYPNTITKLVIGENVTGVGGYAFYGMKINTVEFQGSEKLTNIGMYSFAEMSNLSSLILPESVTSIGMYAFFDDKNLTKINVPSSTSSMGVFAYGNCSTTASKLNIYIDYYVNTPTEATARKAFPPNWDGIEYPYKKNAAGEYVLDSNGNKTYDTSDGFTSPNLLYEVRTIVKDAASGTVVTESDYNATQITYVAAGDSVICKAQPAAGYQPSTWNQYTGASGGEVASEVNYQLRQANQNTDTTTNPVTFTYTATVDENDPVPLKYEAVFTKIQYNVTFNPNNGSFDTTSTRNVAAKGNGKLVFSPSNVQIANSADVKMEYGNTFAEVLGTDAGNANFPVPYRDGYQFAGWWTSTESGTQLKDDGSDTLSTDQGTEIVYYAHWVANSYEVHFHKGMLEGVSGITVSGSTGTEMIDSGSTIYVEDGFSYGTSKKLDKNGFSVSGYDFLGWSTSETSAIVDYKDEEAVTDLAADNGAVVDLYAVWGFTVKYNYGVNAAGTSTNVNMGIKTIVYGGNTQLDTNKYTRNYYSFGGWALETGKGSSDAVLVDKAQVSTDDILGINGKKGIHKADNASTTVNLYATWDVQKYTLSFDGNLLCTLATGDNDSFHPISQPINLSGSNHSALITIPNETPEADPAYSNYSFTGWSTSSSGEGTLYGAGSQISITGDTVLYAIWDTDSYTVSFNGNGADGGKTVSNQTVKYHASVSMPTCTFTRKGYKFAGWGISTTSTTPITVGTSVIITADTTYYALWTPITYNISFDVRNEVTGAEPANINGVKYVTATGGSATISFTIPANEMSRNGYTFLGWATSSTATTATYEAGCSYSDNLTANDGETVTLYDVWSANDYIVTYDANGGNGILTDKTTPKHGQSYTVLKNTGNDASSASGSITWEGHTFIGWNTSETDADAGEVEYTPGQKFTIPLETKTQDGGDNPSSTGVTFYAVWVASRDLTVSIDNGTTFIGTTVDNAVTVNDTKLTYTNNSATLTVAKGKKLSETTPTITLADTEGTGQDFLGWKYVNDGAELNSGYLTTEEALAYVVPDDGTTLELVAYFKAHAYKAEVKSFVEGTVKVSTTSNFSDSDNVVTDGDDPNYIEFYYGDSLYISVEMTDKDTKTLGLIQVKDGAGNTLATYPQAKATALLTDGAYSGTVGNTSSAKGLVPSLTDKEIAEDLTFSFSAAVVENYFQIVPYAGSNGTVSTSPVDGKVNSSGEGTVTITPNEGYYISKVTVNEIDATPSGYTTVSIVKTFTYSDAVNGQVKVDAEFAAVPEYVNVSAERSQYGTIVLSASGKVGKGTSVTVRITPETGYAVKAVYVNGELVSTSTSYTFSADKDSVITVSFTKASTDGGSGGSSTEVSYKIKGTCGTGGSLNFDGTKTVGEGEDFTVIVTPDSGYRVQEMKVDGKSIGRASTYTFENISDDHKVSVTFQRVNYSSSTTGGKSGVYGVLTDDEYYSDGDDYETITKTAGSYMDVNAGAWYYQGVNYVTQEGLFDVSGYYFYPEAYATRGMLVEMIYNNEDQPYVSYNAGFVDVNGYSEYADAINWATAQGIVNGLTSYSFVPDGSITREQLAAILYRYALYSNKTAYGPSTATAGYKDSWAISTYAKNAMNWAVSIGLMSGRDSSTLAPNGLTTRGELCTIMMRYCQYMGR